MSALGPLLALCLMQSPATDAVGRGKAAFDAFQLDVAQQQFSHAAELASTPAERAEAFLWLGVVAAEQGDFTAAKSRFADAVDEDPNVALPDSLSPTIAHLVEEQRINGRVRRGEAPLAHDNALPPAPRWVLMSGGAVVGVGVAALGGGAVLGLQAALQRDVAQAQAFQSDAIGTYQKAREEALWSNVLYGAGGVLIATGSGLAVASLMGADGP